MLVFDEATSSLDSTTEHEISEAIEWLGRRKTIVLIDHRLTTVRNCDRIYLMHKGRLVASGTYADLLRQSHEFRQLAIGVA